MADNKKTNGEGTFLEKVGDFCKKAGVWCKETAVKAWAWTKKTAVKVWAWTTETAKTVWAKLKVLEWNKPVKPVVGWSVYGGAVVLSVVLMLIFWL